MGDGSKLKKILDEKGITITKPLQRNGSWG